MANTFRADQVGSLLRPAELLKARAEMSSPEELRALEDKHILRVIEKQKELCLDVFTDGELRRSNFMSDFNDAVDGFDSDASIARTWKEDEKKGERQTSVSKISGIVVAPLKQRNALTGHELPFLRSHAQGPFKVTFPSATQFPAISFKYGVTDAVYRDPYALLD